MVDGQEKQRRSTFIKSADNRSVKVLFRLNITNYTNPAFLPSSTHSIQLAHRTPKHDKPTPRIGQN